MNITLERIKKAQVNARLTNKEIQEAIGVSRSTWSGWYARDIPPGTEYIAKLAVLLDCSADYLLGLTETASDLSLRDRTLLKAVRGLSDRQVYGLIAFLDAVRPDSDRGADIVDVTIDAHTFDKAEDKGGF